MKTIAIIGSGSWGVALATHLARCGNKIKIWSFAQDEKDMINNERKCKFLPGLVLPDNIECSSDFKDVIEDSELYAMYKNSVYKPLSVAEAISRTKAVIRECQKTNISIIRLGLQSTDEITASNSNIYGPVSDNLAEYVMADIIRDKIEKEIADKEINDELIIYVPKRYVSVCVGPKKINKIYFEQKYNLKYIVKGEI